MSSPKQLNNQAKDRATGNISNIFNAAANGDYNAFSQLMPQFMLPAYGGQLSAGPNAGQLAAVNNGNMALSSFFGSAMPNANINVPQYIPNNPNPVNLGPSFSGPGISSGSNPFAPNFNMVSNGAGRISPTTSPPYQITDGGGQQISNVPNLAFGGGGGLQMGQNILGTLQGFANNPMPVAGMGDLSAIAGGNNPLFGNIQSLANTGNQYTGQLAGAGANALNINDIGVLNSLAGGNTGDQSGLRNLTTQTPQGFNQAQALTAQMNNPALQALLGFNSSSPEQAMLQGNAAANFLGAAQNPLSAAVGNLENLGQSQALTNLMNTGGGTDFASIYNALNAQRKIGLGQDVRDLREQFSNSGLRNSDALANALATRQTQSEQNLLADVSQLAPQLAATTAQNRLGAAQALAGINSQLGGIGQGIGQLGLGQQQNITSALNAAGTLGLNAAGLNLNALSNAGNLAQTEFGQRRQLASNLAGIGAQVQANRMNALQNLIQSQYSAAAQAGNEGLQANQLNINALANAGQLTNQNQEIRLGALNQLLGTQAGAASNLTQASLNQNAQRLQAALALPNAYTSINSLPIQLAQAQYALNAGPQQLQQDALSRAYQAFLQQQQGLPMALGFLNGGQPTTYGPSTIDQILGGAGTIAGIISMFG